MVEKIKHLTIGRLAKEIGTNIETIRYYERRGLIVEPPRQASGYRAFPPEYIDRIRFIKRAQTLGFTLKEISQLLTLADGNFDCKDIRKFAEEKIKDIETRIHDLQKIHEILHDLVKKCLSKEKSSSCPIIGILTQHKTQK